MSREGVPQQPEESPVIRAQGEAEEMYRKERVAKGGWEGSSRIAGAFLDQIYNDLPNASNLVRLNEAKRRLAYLSGQIEGTLGTSK